MNSGLILAIFVFAVVALISRVRAADCSSSRECQDLENLQKKLVKGVKIIPGFDVKCKPNSNCTGLTCNGKAKGKPFQGTVILEGCHKPVRMVVHFGDRRMYVKNGFKKQVLSKPLKVRVGVNLVKKGDVVFVTLKVWTYLGKWWPYTVLKDQPITVHCNSTTGSQRLCHLSSNTTLSGKGLKNPECKGQMNTGMQVERRFKVIKRLYPDSKIDCKPASNCSELRCKGVANKDKFNATATIDYCSDPVKLHVAVDVPNKKIHVDHNFKNGESYQLTSIPPISMKVNMKRVRNVINVTVSISIPGVNYDLVKNMSITVDPSHCQGYHAWTTMTPTTLPPAIKWKCKKMAVVAQMIQKRLSDTNSFLNMNCVTAKKCSVIRCSGMEERGDFQFDAALNSCTSPPTLDFTMLEPKQKTLHFKNGRNSLWNKSLDVQMQKVGRYVRINASLGGFRVLDGAEMPYDPSDCPTTSASGLKNPECKSQMNAGKQVERQLKKIYPNSKVDCKPANNCSELRCKGVANKDKFNATATIDYCSDPVKLHVAVDVPNKKIHVDHNFKNGESYQLTSIPPISMKVNMKRVRNVINVTVSISIPGVNYDLVKNMSITVDPSHCQGYHAWTTMTPTTLPPAIKWKCKKMAVVAQMIQKRLSDTNSFLNMNCVTAKKCSVIRCSGMEERGDFQFDAALNSCTSPPTLDFTMLEPKQKTLHFKNGRNSLWNKSLDVQMQKVGRYVRINASLGGFRVLDGAEMPYDPSDCPTTSASGHSLSGGAIGGVVVAVIIFFVVLIAVIVWIVRGKRIRRASRYNGLAMDDDTDRLYFVSDPVA